MSQTIHDTTAQSAYMLGLGLEQAVEMSERGDAALTGKLVAMGELSRSAMWALRHPIDGGEIFGGGRLGEVLESHADTFTVITGITAELAQQGAEPELSTITRSPAVLDSAQRPDQCVSPFGGRKRHHLPGVPGGRFKPVGVGRRAGSSGKLRCLGARFPKHESGTPNVWAVCWTSTRTSLARR